MIKTAYDKIQFDGWVKEEDHTEARRLLSDGLRLAGLGEDMSVWMFEVSQFFDK